MRSSKRPTRLLLSLASLALCMTPSACGPRINVSLTALPCPALLDATHLLDPTPGASRPVNDTAGELAAFGDRQTGQVDKGNQDKKGATDFIHACQAEQEAAAKELKKRPLLARIFDGGG